MSSQTHGFAKENAMCPPCGDTAGGATGASAGMMEQGTQPGAVASPLTEFSTSETSGFPFTFVGMVAHNGSWQSFGFLGDVLPSLVCSGRERSAE